MVQGMSKVEPSHFTICIFRRFHQLFRDVLRPSRFYRFQVRCWVKCLTFSDLSVGKTAVGEATHPFLEDLALLILNQSWDIFALTPTRGLNEGNQILEFWRLRVWCWGLVG